MNRARMLSGAGLRTSAAATLPVPTNSKIAVRLDCSWGWCIPGRVMMTVPEKSVPPVVQSEPSLEQWFAEEPPPSSRRPSTPPPPSVKVGEFLGDELADSWLR